jgi:FemAB-related protein (PEP-CTERM system-associated)
VKSAKGAMGAKGVKRAKGVLTVRVDRLDGGERSEWQAFVRRSTASTLFHDLRWGEAVRSAFQHRPFHLMAREGSTVRGVLPLFEVRSVFSGRSLVSVPYGVYGGIAADDARAAEALLEAAAALGQRLGVDRIELRHLAPNRFRLPGVDRYVTFTKGLPSAPEECLGALPRKARAAARQAIERHQLNVDFGPHLLGAVYDLYARNVRRLGSPVYPRRFFEALVENFGEACVCEVVSYQGLPVAGLLSFVFKDRMMPYYSGSLPEYAHVNPNNFLYLKAMEYGVSHGCRVFDFGRTRRENSGPYQFKVNQGFEPQTLPYQVVLIRAREVSRLDPGEARFALAERLWRRLPLPLTKWIGGVVTRSIP